MAWLLFNVHSKIQEQRNDLKMERLIRREAELKSLENSQPVRLAKNEKACSEENTKRVAKEPLMSRLAWLRAEDFISHLSGKLPPGTEGDGDGKE